MLQYIFQVFPLPKSHSVTDQKVIESLTCNNFTSHEFYSTDDKFEIIRLQLFQQRREIGKSVPLDRFFTINIFPVLFARAGRRFY